MAAFTGINKEKKKLLQGKETIPISCHRLEEIEIITKRLKGVEAIL